MQGRFAVDLQREKEEGEVELWARHGGGCKGGGKAKDGGLWHVVVRQLARQHGHGVVEQMAEHGRSHQRGEGDGDVKLQQKGEREGDGGSR